jgi:hypothetical protein
MIKKILYVAVISIIAFFAFRETGTNYFDIAKNKMNNYNPPRKDYVIVIDYRKNILQKRLYLINMKTGNTEIESRVAHAFRSGLLYPTDFSNVNETKKSCVGDFLTLTPYDGKLGRSMLIKGLNKGVNDNTLSRSIIFHSTKPQKFMWSAGCFATPDDNNKKIIELTKGGCLVVVLS